MSYSQYSLNLLIILTLKTVFPHKMKKDEIFKNAGNFGNA